MKIEKTVRWSMAGGVPMPGSYTRNRELSRFSALLESIVREAFARFPGNKFSEKRVAYIHRKSKRLHVPVDLYQPRPRRKRNSTPPAKI
jgi:hypothetical protein